jgi:hypothetical protein
VYALLYVGKWNVQGTNEVVAILLPTFCLLLSCVGFVWY